MNGRFRLQPDSVAILNDLGTALAALGRHDQAVARYQQAFALTPDVAILHHNLACSLDMLNETHRALVHFERALAPSNPTSSIPRSVSPMYCGNSAASTRPTVPSRR